MTQRDGERTTEELAALDGRCTWCEGPTPHQMEFCRWCASLRAVARFVSIRCLELALRDKRDGLL